MRRCLSRLSRLATLWIADLLLLPAAAYSNGASICSITPIDPPPFYLGDTVKFQIDLTIRQNEKITGYEFYLTLDPAIFRPVLVDGRPFEIGELPVVETGGWNDMHGDSLHLPHNANGMPGWQLDCFFRTPVAGGGGERPTITESGVAAYFSVEILGLPPDPNVLPRLDFDFDYYPPVGRGRYTRYHRYLSSPETEFQDAIGYDVDLAGLAISPAIPDTVIDPGSGLNIYLGDHFYSNVVDSSAAIWTLPLVSPAPLPSGADLIIVPSGPSPSSRLTLATIASNHFILDAIIELEGTDPGHPSMIFNDQQSLRIVVDHVPVFDVALPSFTFDEDTRLSYQANAATGGTIFTDLDDAGPNLTLWLEPDSPVHLNYDSATDTVTFYADTNWFGSYPARLFVQDALGLSADTLLTFTVNSINDPPVVNFDSVSVLGDTVVIHRATPDTLDLKLFVTDVDDPVLTWSVNNPDPANLTATFPSVNHLRLLAADNAAYVDIDLIITATDDEGASDSDTLVVSIRSWPPDISVLEDIKINSQGTPPAKGLDLTQWVTDLDTPPANMTWAFRALDAGTYANDGNVTFSPTSGSVTDTVTISVPSNYSAIDILEMTVTDDAANTDIDTARLFIFDGDAPMIFPLPGLTIYRDTTYAGILDLDDYVADLQDNPAAIDWSYLDRDSLESFSIDLYSHEVTITTNTTFIGNLTVSLVATNSRGLRDTSDLAILVSRRVDGPPIWYAVPDEVEVVYNWTTDLFTYGQICYDETPTDQIIFTPYCDTTLLTVTIVPPDSVKLTVPPARADDKYTTQLYFSARDEIDSVSNSGTITVNVKDSFSPDWQRIPTISLNVGETFSGLFLQDYVSDRDTPDDLLTIEVVNLNLLIDVSYDPVTTELTVRASDKPSDSRLIITATDDKGNAATVLAHVVVFAVADYDPPAGGLTYFFNPATDRWINYVVVTDSTTDISRFTWHYSYGTPPRDYSNFLSFAMKDSLPGTLTWIAPYHFRDEGTYHLSVVITDANNNMLEPIPSLALSVGLSKAMGDVLTSPDQQLTVSYPPASIPAGKLLIISEDSLPVSAGLSIAKTLSARGNKENGSQVPATVYSLDTNLPEPILVTLTYHQNREADPYYSFYEVDGDRLLKIETYTSTDGHFEAAVMMGKDIVFASSDTPARKAPLPGAELLCYPNPFNATIQVRFLLRREDRGRIVIYNLLGREVYASPRQPFGPGVHAFSWHSIDKRGLPAPSGAYFIRLETDGGKIVTRKVTLLK